MIASQVSKKCATFSFHLSFIFVSLFNFSAFSKNTPDNEVLSAKVSSWLSTSSEKGFLENKGQMCDNEGKPVPFVLFKTEAPNLNIWITESGLTIQTLLLRKEEIDVSEMNAIEKQDSKHANMPKKRKYMDWERIDLEFKGAQIKKENIVKEGAGESDFNFFYGHCQNGIYAVKEFQKITIKNIYPNIDWVIYRKKEGEIKYDFVVHAGANYKQIELIYKSKNKIILSAEGQLEFETQYGGIIEKKPISFCKNNSIATQFKLNYQLQQLINGDQGFESSFSFAFENFNASSTEDLIIDPDLVWSTFYGGNNLDGPTSIDTDQDGNIFVAGYVGSSNFPTLNPLGGSYFQGTFGSVGDVMLLKFNNAGQRLWATYYGGSGNDRGWFVTTDVNGNVYVTGDTEGPDFPTLNAGAGAYFQNVVQGQLDVFVLKFNNSGVLQFGTCFGGNNLDFGFAISIDNSGNFYVTGQTNSTDLPTLDMGAGSYYQANIGNANAFNSFLIKFNSIGVLLWSTYYGGSSYETGYGVTNDALGNVFMVGKSESSDFPLLNAGGSSYFQSNGGIGNSNAYVVKFSNTGVRLWATSFGGSLIDEALSVITDDNGDVIISGKTNSNNFPLLNPGAGAYFQGTFGGVIDIFIARFTNTGTQLWTTYFGGTSGENQSWFDNLAIDSCGNIYMTLSSAINDIPLLAQCEGGYLDNSFIGSDVILVMFSNTNKLLWSTFIGGSGLDFQGALAIDFNKNVFVSGEWCGAINPATYPLVNAGGNSYYDGTFNGGGDDGFVLKFSPTLPIINTTTINPACANLCAGEASVNINGSCNYNFLWSNGQNTQTATGLCPGNYTVQITNPICGGLDTLIQIVIAAPPTAITPNFAAISNFCAGDIIQALPTTSINNVSGIWTPAINNNATTTYTFTPNVGQCALDTQLTIQINPLPIANASSNSPVCENQTLNLNVNATIGASYSWFGPNGFTASQQSNLINAVNTSASGNYIVIVEANGCSNSDTLNVGIIQHIQVSQNIQICNGQSFILPDGSIVDTAGIYIQNFLSVAGCDSNITTTVSVVNTINTSINAQICLGQTYQLPNGDFANSPGIYTVVIQNQLGCDSTITINLSDGAFLLANAQIVAHPTGPICENSKVFFTSILTNGGASPQLQWFLNGAILQGEINDTLFISNLHNNDIVSLQMISNLNCILNPLCNSNSIEFNVNANPVIDIPMYEYWQYLGDSIQLSANTNVSNPIYNWSSIAYVSCYNCSNPYTSATDTTLYLLTVTDSETGCFAVDSIIIYTLDNSEVFLPTGFSPNGDQINDVFYFRGIGIKDFNLNVFDRWGELIFTTNSFSVGWDGSYKGKPAIEGTYVYTLNYTNFKKINKFLKGNLTLIK